jgi:hypothetical protein
MRVQEKPFNIKLSKNIGFSGKCALFHCMGNPAPETLPNLCLRKKAFISNR